jgi:hypothetical protein
VVISPFWVIVVPLRACEEESDVMLLFVAKGWLGNGGIVYLAKLSAAILAVEPSLLQTDDRLAS